MAAIPPRAPVPAVPAASSTSSSAVASWDPEKGPNVKFARFVEGQLTFFNAYTTELEYIAVSHVWGDVAFRPIPHPGIQGEFKISESKAAFVSKDLPGIVGDMAFWMDTLTVNQRDQAEVISVVNTIPRIFRNAVRTLAIRENDGIYPCCEGGLDNFADWQEFFDKLVELLSEHYDDIREESYLQRLWTLQ